MTRATRLPVIFYNLHVGRSHVTVARELAALATGKPAFIACVEAVNYDLPHLPGYRLVRDQTNPGRDNVACYVRDDITIVRTHWRDLHQTWFKQRGHGQHPARSILVLRLNAGGTLFRLVVLHIPPRQPGVVKGNHAALAAQQASQAESFTAAQQILGRANIPALAVGDWNCSVPRELEPIAKAVSGEVVGNRIDAAIVKGCTATRVRYVTHAGLPGQVLPLESDHKHALSFVLHVARG